MIPFCVIKSILTPISLPIPRCCKASLTSLSPCLCVFRCINFYSSKVNWILRSNLFIMQIDSSPITLLFHAISPTFRFYLFDLKLFRSSIFCCSDHSPLFFCAIRFDFHEMIDGSSRFVCYCFFSLSLRSDWIWWHWHHLLWSIREKKLWRI